MSVKVNTYKQGDFRYIAGAGRKDVGTGGHKLLLDQDILLQRFKKHGNVKKLRRDFKNLRRQHLEDCLIAYANDLRETCYYESAGSVRELLDIKLKFYVKRFEKDVNLLFDSPWRNKLAISRFRKAGNEIVNHLIVEV